LKAAIEQVGAIVQHDRYEPDKFILSLLTDAIEQEEREERCHRTW
jgi:hypothetical protein